MSAVEKQDILPLRILLLDDDELVAEYLADLLQAEGYQVAVYNDSALAVSDFQSMQDNFDLVITDQMMPGMTGVEVAASILQQRPDMPIFLITGYSEKVNLNNASTFGFKSYFSKPINEDAFLSQIRQLF